MKQEACRAAYVLRVPQEPDLDALYYIGNSNAGVLR